MTSKSFLNNQFIINFQKLSYVKIREGGQLYWSAFIEIECILQKCLWKINVVFLSMLVYGRPTAKHLLWLKVILNYQCTQFSHKIPNTRSNVIVSRLRPISISERDFTQQPNRRLWCVLRMKIPNQEMTLAWCLNLSPNLISNLSFSARTIPGAMKCSLTLILWICSRRWCDSIPSTL